MPKLVQVEEPKPVQVDEPKQQTPEQFAAMAPLGDVEFEASLQEALDPISRLGFDPQRALLATQKSAAVYSRDLDIINIGAKYTGSKGVWAHEFRHRGFRMMRDTFDREEFSKRFGEGPAAVLFDMGNEKLVELFDRELKPPDWKDDEGVIRKFEETYDFGEFSFTDEQRDDLIRILSMAAKEAMGSYGRLVPVHPKGMQ